MALFTIMNYKYSRIILKILNPFFFIILSLSVITFFSIIYNGIEKRADYAQFCYALFAANAIICNTLFGLGRSAIFIEKFDSKEQNWIYYSALMFLCAAFLTFFFSGWVYVNVDKDFAGNGFLQKSTIGKQLLLISLTVGLGFSIIFSMFGIGYFIKWSSAAIKKAASRTQ